MLYKRYGKEAALIRKLNTGEKKNQAIGLKKCILQPFFP